MNKDTNKINWNTLIQQEKSKPYYQKLTHWLALERAAGKSIYPPENKILAALKKTPFHETKVVILGQDPYHGMEQANGLCFSVTKGTKIPPSLRNILKEINHSLGYSIPDNGDLSLWAEQGVLLLNTVLTVEQAKPQSHKNKGWETFTNEIIQYLNQAPKTIVFLLWGTPARKKKNLIDLNKHIVLEAPHPSPLSAYRGFFGCDHFKKANEILSKAGRKKINWDLSKI